MRLFAAICFPPPFKRGLLSMIARLRELYPQGNFTEEQNLHLTLAFIGETERVTDAVKAIDAAVSEEETPAFALKLGGFGRFGEIFWAGVEPNAALDEIAERIQSELRARDFAIEVRKFTPHITLARCIPAFAPADIRQPFAEMKVGRVSLMKSERIEGRLVYSEIYEKNLL